MANGIRRRPIPVTGIGLLAFSGEGGAVCVWKAHKKN